MSVKAYGIDKIESLKEDPKYKAYRIYLQERGTHSLKDIADNVTYEFGIKSWLRPVVYEFIKSGVVDESLANQPVSLSRDNVYADLRLELAHDITQPVLKQFITANWSTVIKPKLSPFNAERHTVNHFHKRDNSIYKTYINRKKLGLTIVGVALMHSVSESTVKRVVRSRKKLFS